MRVVASVLLTATVVAVATTGSAHADEETIGYDTSRTNWDLNEPGLTPTSVKAADFGKLWSTTLPRNGRSATSMPNQMYAQPLIAHGKVIVATEDNQVDGLDPVTGQVLWTKSLGPAWSSPRSCANITPHVGVTSTPVYDPVGRWVYVVAKVDDGVNSAHPHLKMFAFNPVTGAARSGWPINIGGNPTNGGPRFNAETANQRVGLLLLGGRVYVATASHCDHGPYVGYVVGVDTTTRRMKVWAAESKLANDKAGIWQSGGGLVSDGPGRILLTTGNGVSPRRGPGTSPPGTLAESVVRLRVNSDGSMTAKDFFSPSNNAQLDQNDTDLGSGGPTALPASFGTARVPHVLLQVGKSGRVYLLNRDHLGGMGQRSNGGDAVLSETQLGKGVWGRAAVFSGGGKNYAYVQPTYSPMQALRIGPNSSGIPTVSIAGATALSAPYTSGSPVVTSVGNDPASALVWVITCASDGSKAFLRAYPATPPRKTAWSPIVSYGLKTVAKFIQPATDGGRVYVGTRDGRVLAFGRPVGASLNAAAVDFGLQPVGTTTAPAHQVTLTATRTVTITNVAAAAPFSAGAPSRPLPATLNTGDTLTFPVQFTPTAAGSTSGALRITMQGISGTYDVSLSGVGTQDGLSSDPAGLDFALVSTKMGKELGVTIQNTGATATTLTSFNSPSAPYSVTGLPGVGSTLGPQQSVTISVKFAPSVKGPATDSLMIHSSTGDLTIPLTGTGFSGSPHMTLSPPTLKFGNVAPGASVTKSFTLTNDGDANLTITKAGVPGAPFLVAFPIGEGQVLNPGDSLMVNVTLAPTTGKPAKGAYSVTSDDGTGPQTVMLDGNSQPWVGAVPSGLKTCLTIQGAVPANDAAAVSSPCDGQAGQQLLKGAASSIRLDTATRTWCLAVTGAGKTAGTTVHLLACDGGVAQQWTWRSDNSLYNPNSKMCLDISHSSTTAGTPLQIHRCNKTSAQSWDFSNLQQTRGAASSGLGPDNQICMQDANASTAAGNPIVIANCNLSSGQILTRNGTTLRFFGRCVSVAGTANGTKVVLGTCNGSAGEVWKGSPTDLRLQNPASGKCLDVPRSSTTSGTQLELHRCNGTGAQQWRLPS